MKKTFEDWLAGLFPCEISELMCIHPHEMRIIKGKLLAKDFTGVGVEIEKLLRDQWRREGN